MSQSHKVIYIYIDGDVFAIFFKTTGVNSISQNTFVFAT